MAWLPFQKEIVTKKLIVKTPKKITHLCNRMFAAMAAHSKKQILNNNIISLKCLGGS